MAEYSLLLAIIAARVIAPIVLVGGHVGAAWTAPNVAW